MNNWIQFAKKLEKEKCFIHNKSANISVQSNEVEINSACCEKFEAKLTNLFADEMLNNALKKIKNN